MEPITRSRGHAAPSTIYESFPADEMLCMLTEALLPTTTDLHFCPQTGLMLDRQH